VTEEPITKKYDVDMVGELSTVDAALASSAAAKIEAAGYEEWLRSMFPRHLSKQMGWFHDKFWAKAWAVAQAPESFRPAPLALPWFRSGAKSTSIRAAGGLLAALRKRRFILYFSGVQDAADRHVTNLGRMISSSNAAKYYPDLATAQVNEMTGSNVSWSRQQLVTKSGLVVVALGMNSVSRGINFDELRPDLIIIDDIDDQNDSAATVLKKIGTLAGDIFPTQQSNTWIVFAQNVIHSGSVMHKVLDGSGGILLNREVIGPVPAAEYYEYERFTGENGIRQYRVTQWRGSWDGFSREQGEQVLNESGPEYFEREYQHNTEILPAGAIYPACDPKLHYVTWSEFCAYMFRNGVEDVYERDEFGRIKMNDGTCPLVAEGRPVPQLPGRWTKGLGHDYGTTLDHPSVLKWATTPGEDEPLGGLPIFYRERVLPKYPHRHGDAVLPVSPMRVCKLIREEEWRWAEDQAMYVRVMSHEQSAAQLTYLFDEESFSDYDGLNFQKVYPDRWGGIAQMQNFFEVDYSRPHQFRVYPAGYKVQGTEVGGLPLPGAVRMLFLVADGQGELYVDEAGRMRQRQGRDDDGQARSRDERLKYVEKMNANGTAQKVPSDLFNDAMDAERFLAGGASAAGVFFVPPAAMSREQRARRRVEQKSPHLAEGAIAEREEAEQDRAWAAREVALDAARREVDAPLEPESPLARLRAARGGDAYEASDVGARERAQNLERARRDTHWGNNYGREGLSSLRDRRGY
jgi:hypothetical protein